MAPLDRSLCHGPPMDPHYLDPPLCWTPLHKEYIQNTGGYHTVGIHQGSIIHISNWSLGNGSLSKPIRPNRPK